MEQRRFGPLDVEVPVIGLGTWQMEADDRESAILAIRRAIELGARHIDTAEIYGKGAVEELVGEALAGYRGDAFLTTKVHPEQATFAGTLRACEKSLRRLRTDHIDLYLLHWRGSLPLEETFRAFEALKSEGKIRAWGVSNFDISSSATPSTSSRSAASATTSRSSDTARSTQVSSRARGAGKATSSAAWRQRTG